MTKIYTCVGGPVAANTYVVTSDNKSAIVIDPTDLSSLCDILDKHSLTLKAVLLTHGHFDHIWALVSVTEKFDVPVYVHSLDIPMLTDARLNVAAPYGFDLPGKFTYKGALPVYEGQIINVADMSFMVIHTPGHSLGSVCYCVEDIIFSGDTLLKLSAGRTDGYGGSTEELMKSLSRLYHIDGNTRIFPGHGEPSTISFERLFNPFLSV